MKKMLFTIALIMMSYSLYAQLVKPPEIPERKYSILEYDADVCSEDNTEAIQSALDACTVAGGGWVVVPKGTFLCGPVEMKASTGLYLAKGAVLQALPYGEGNGTLPNTYPNSGETNRYAHLISARKCDNLRIAGEGTIEGDGEAWWKAFRASRDFKRGCLIRFDGCKNIAIEGITLQNAPNVHITIGKGSSDAAMRNLTIMAPEYAPNSDGIDTWARNILIENCRISVGDDNVAMDTGTKNIVIRNCEFGDGHGCSIGSYAGSVENVLVDNCRFDGTESAIRMKSDRTRGGGERNITYSNLTISGVKNPLYITSYYPRTPKHPEDDQAVPVTAKTPLWENVVIRNVKIIDCERAGIIWGVPEQRISDLILDNVQIEAQKNFIINNAKNVKFMNGSSIKTPGCEAIKTYNSTFSGIDSESGLPIR